MYCLHLPVLMLIYNTTPCSKELIIIKQDSLIIIRLAQKKPTWTRKYDPMSRELIIKTR
jgi:hypothetical protein